MTTEPEKDSVFKIWRILVVENDPRQRSDHVFNLVGWGYDVYVAECQPGATDAFESLKNDAIGKISQFCCHLALVDQRLKSDVDPDDESGLELARQLDVFGYVILSAYATHSTAGRFGSNSLYIGKHEGPERLKDALDNLIREIFAERWISSRPGQ